MGKWIDADALEYDTEWSEYHDGFTAYSQMAIDTTPSIDIVRCKDCKWAKANGTYQWCGRLDSTARITADDFCSYGQKGDENVETD